MNWVAAPLSSAAPVVASDKKFDADADVWHLSLDQIESGTGEVLFKQCAPMSKAGTSTFVFDEGNVLYSKLRPYLNKVVIPDEAGVATTELVPLRPNPTVLDRCYLAYYLRAPRFVAEASQRVAGAKMPRVSMDWLRAHEIPLPPPSEQRRIVEILNQADALRKRTREADAKAARILPALFLKMFGDPATNPMGWPIHPLRKAIAAIDPGWSAPSEARTRAAHEFGVLKVSAVTSGTFLPSEHKAVTTDVDGRALIAPRKGDLLFSRANTRELVAATCIVEHDEPMLFLSDKLWRITPDKQEADGLFLKMLLTNEFVRDQIRSRASGSSGSMLNVSQNAVLRTEVTLPPITKQKPFSENARRVLSILRSSEEPARRVEAIWHLLMNRAFSGQLTAKWREAHMQELLAEMQKQACLLSRPAPN